MELYTAITRNGQRAALAVTECGVDCRFHMMDIYGDALKSPEYLAINPSGKIPTLIDADGLGSKPLILRQSWAILIYLAEETGRFMPNDNLSRVRMWQWVAEAATDMAPTNATVAILRQQIPYLKDRVTEPTPASVVQHFDDSLRSMFRITNDHLADMPYFAGDEITIADIGFFPTYDSRKEQIDPIELVHLTLAFRNSGSEAESLEDSI